MTIFLLVLTLMLIGAGGMAIGVIFGRKPLTGSCGGLANSGVAGGGPCEICGNDPDKCESGDSSEAAGDRAERPDFYNAGR